jgi:glycosyl transferase family 25
MNSFYINLDERPDRKAQFENECQRMDLTVERFPAVRTYPGLSGCSQSHLRVLKLARDRKYPSIMVFEDDFEFLITKEEFQAIINSLPEDYDVVMLSYNLIKSEPYNEQFGKALEVQTASGYIVHSRFYDKLIAIWEEGLSLLQEHDSCSYDSIYLNDQYWKQIQPMNNWYYSCKRVGKQRGSWSNLYEKPVYYGV